jgi:hypothetical protein
MSVDFILTLENIAPVDTRLNFRHDGRLADRIHNLVANVLDFLLACGDVVNVESTTLIFNLNERFVSTRLQLMFRVPTTTVCGFGFAM